MLLLTCSSALLILYCITVFYIQDIEKGESYALFVLASLHLLATFVASLYMPPIIVSDAKHYWTLGFGQLLFYVKQNTLYPMIIQLFKSCHPGAIPSDFTLFQSLCSSINVLLFFYFGRRLYSNKLGMVAAAFAALWIPFVEFAGSMILTETFGITFGIFLMIKLLDCTSETSSKKDFGILGFVLGIAFLLKFSFYIWFIAISIIFLLYSALRKNILKGFLLYVTAFYLTAGVYYVRNYYFFGEAFLTNSGYSLLETTVDPYPGMFPKAGIKLSGSYDALDKGHIGTGITYMIPITTYYNVAPFIRDIELLKAPDGWVEDAKFIKLKKRASDLVNALGISGKKDAIGTFYWQYLTNILGKEYYKTAKSRYLKALFTASFYKNFFIRFSEYLTYPVFGRLSYYYHYAQAGTEYSEHYVHPLLIFFEHYMFLFLCMFGAFFYIRALCNGTEKVSDETLVLTGLVLLHLTGFSLAHVPEMRFNFPVIPCLFLVAGYGFIGLVRVVRSFILSWE